MVRDRRFQRVCGRWLAGSEGLSGRLSRAYVMCVQVDVSERRRALRSAVESYRMTCVQWVVTRPQQWRSYGPLGLSVKPLNFSLTHFRSCFSTSCCSDLNAATVVYLVSLNLQKRKAELRFCRQCGELCRSITSSDKYTFGTQTG
jgi:hypothetical protein